MTDQFDPLFDLKHIYNDLANGNWGRLCIGLLCGYNYLTNGATNNEAEKNINWSTVWDSAKKNPWNSTLLALIGTPVILPITVYELGLASVKQGLNSINNIQKSRTQHNTPQAILRFVGVLASLGATAGMMKAGFIAGAALGSVIAPGLGTAWGGAIGTVIGFFLSFGPTQALCQKLADNIVKGAPSRNKSSDSDTVISQKTLLPPATLSS